MSDQRAASPFDLRVFALLLTPFVWLVGTWFGRLLLVPALGQWAALATLPVSLAGLIRPEDICPIYVLWMKVVTPIGIVVSVGLLVVIYFLVVTPLGLALRAFGIDPAQRKRLPTAESYWTEHSARDEASYFRRF